YVFAMLDKAFILAVDQSSLWIVEGVTFPQVLGALICLVEVLYNVKKQKVCVRPGGGGGGGGEGHIKGEWIILPTYYKFIYF
ncbi:hypothetical protein ACJX0J_025897, partial [Zea mays]